MKPRSIILDLFGDYLRYAGAEIKLGDMTKLLAVFGVEPATVRVSMSRLKKEGWFTTRRQQRNGLRTDGENAPRPHRRPDADLRPAAGALAGAMDHGHLPGAGN